MGKSIKETIRSTLIHHGPMSNLIYQNVKNCYKLTLNGLYVWEYFARDTFYRIGENLGHGLCYEAAALMMLAWHDWPQTQLVYASCYSDTLKTRADHSWMEFKAYGIWWVIDPTWRAPAPVPRYANNLHFDTRYDRIIKKDEFWQWKISQKLYKRLKEPDGSCLFQNLVLFRRSKNSKKAILERYHIEDLIAS